MVKLRIEPFGLVATLEDGTEEWLAWPESTNPNYELTEVQE